MSDNSKRSVVIFDFDGTIADTMAMVSEIANSILPENGRPEGLSKSDIKKMRSMSIPQGLKYLNIPTYRLPKIAILAKQEISNRINELQPIDGMVEVPKQLHADGWELGIVSSNTKKNVLTFLRRHNIKHLFSFIDTGASVFGKARHIRGTMRRQRLKVEQCVYVGDEVRDIEASHTINMPVISVTWGANSASFLKEHRPLELVDSPSSLKKAITKHFKD